MVPMLQHTHTITLSLKKKVSDQCITDNILLLINASHKTQSEFQKLTLTQPNLFPLEGQFRALGTLMAKGLKLILDSGTDK